MGLFSWFKRELLEVIEWTGDDADTLVWKFPNDNRKEIMNSSTLVVRPGQAAIFVHKGQIADVFREGSYKLATENIPFLTSMLSLPTGGNSPIKADIYYVNMKKFAGLKWGTKNPVMMRDKEFGNIRLRGFGTYAFKIIDPKMFLRDISGTNGNYTVSELEEVLKPMIISGLTDCVASSKISALDLASNYEDFGNELEKASKEKFNEYGVELVDVVFENLSLPEEVEKALDERTKLGVLEDKVGTYTRIKVADAIGDAAKNEGSGSLAGMGVGLGAGAGMGQMFANSMSFENPKKEKETVECEECGYKMEKGQKFCPNCGASVVNICPNCKTVNEKGAKFCSNCGEKLEQKGNVCPHCGAKIRKNAKFCGECGKNVRE